MKKIAALFLFSLVFIAPCVAAEKPVIKIGVIAGLSGEWAAWGESFRNAITLAHDSHAPTRFDYQLIFEDSFFDSSRSALAAQKLIKSDQVNALITSFDRTGEIVNSLAEKAGVPHIGIATNPLVAAGYYNFTHFTTARDMANRLVISLKKHNIRRVALLALKDTFAVTYHNAVMTALKASRIEIADNRFFSAQERDFRLLIAQASQTKPEMFVLMTCSPTLEILARQLRESGHDNITGMEIFENTTQHNLFEGLWYVGSTLPENNFLKNFQDKFHSNPLLGSANGFDAYNLIVQACESMPSTVTKPTGKQIAGALLHISDFHGAMGALAVDSEGVFHSLAVEKVIKKGEPELVAP